MGAYICTFIGVAFRAVCTSLLGAGVATSNDNASFTLALCTGLAVILTAIGVLISLAHAKGGKNKLIQLGIHAGIWIIGTLIVKIFVPICILLVLGVIVYVFVLHGSLSSLGSIASREPEPEPEPEVEVWRENGLMNENLKVSRDGKRYYDPDDCEWHNIE